MRLDELDNDINNSFTSMLAQLNSNMPTLPPIVPMLKVNNEPINNQFGSLNMEMNVGDLNIPSVDFSDGGNSSYGVDTIVNTARSMLNKRYKWGASTNSNTYADCSSLTKKAAANAGLNIPRTAQQQYDFFKNNGRLINNINGAKVGDFVYFNFRNSNKNPIGHTAIITGINNGRIKVIEASGSHHKVIERWLPASYYKHIAGIGVV